MATKKSNAGPLMCRCGCNTPAQYLVDGRDVGANGHSPGKAIKAEPCCSTAALYLKDAHAEAGFRFKMTPVNSAKPATYRVAKVVELDEGDFNTIAAALKRDRSVAYEIFVKRVRGLRPSEMVHAMMMRKDG